MKKSIVLSVISFFLILAPNLAQAFSDHEIMRATQIVNLEAQPVWFGPSQPIDFVVTVKYDGGTQDGFDVGVFHGRRIVGWEMNKRFVSGMNTFRLHDANFRGEPGGYIVKLRYKGRIFTEKTFVTKSHCSFTIDPRATSPR